ncbi:hypothetical protein G6F68_017388 [Rhizopus microsporus]|nr:hypothetical protein G6F68_017388 [Rhizopus microsporus]
MSELAMVFERKWLSDYSHGLEIFRKEIGKMNIGEGRQQNILIFARRGVRSKEVNMAVSPSIEDEVPRATKRRASTEAGVAMVSV